MMWPDCSPPSAQAALQHLLHHVLVADRRADQIDAAIAERKFQPDVAHHRGDHRLAGQPAFLAQMIRREQQHGVAVHGLAVAIDEQRAIAVAVERHAQARAAGDDLGLQTLQMRRPAIQVDVAAVRLVRRS